MKILIDTGATTSFISNRSLVRIHPSPAVHSKQTSFVLADGIAPFHTIGVVDLSIQFADQLTPIQAHVVPNLCTDLIIGMDYINRYYLTINVRNQTLSIQCQDRWISMPIDQGQTSIFTPLILSSSITILPSVSLSVAFPISSRHSIFIPDSNFQRQSLIVTSVDLFQIDDHSTILKLFNSSSSDRIIPEGTCIGYLVKPSSSQPMLPAICTIPQSSDDASLSGMLSATTDLVNSTTDDSLIRTVIPTHLQQLIDHITIQTDCRALSSLLLRFQDVFDTSKHNIAKTCISHVITTVPHSPPASRPYTNPDKDEALYTIIQEFLSAGLISESNSPYAAPAMLVKKSDGSHRLVVDYKKLNLITIKDCSPLPNMEDVLRKLGHGYQFFSKLDLKSGFYQIPIHAQDKQKTAFITPFGLYHFNVLPMGLKNSPPTFQKVMTDALKPCRAFSLVYLDDIVIFSSSFDEHITHLEQVFHALQAKHIVLNPPKCVLAKPEINYLGHTVAEHLIKPNNEKIQAILDIPEPRTLAQANKFLGAISWYRKFLPHSATVAAPLHTITNLPKSLRSKFKWTSIHSEAFQQLKHLLTTGPLFLHFPVAQYPLILSTDASNVAIGGVLQQDINGDLRNLYYHSQLMSPCQRRYSTIEKEALAILKCFERMRPYIIGRDIILMTDHCPLCNIMQKTVKNNRVDRISTLIQEFNITQVLHIKGRTNCLPDFLSRYPGEPEDDLWDGDYGLENKVSNPSLTVDPKSPLYSIHSSQMLPDPIATMQLRSRSKPIRTTPSQPHTASSDVSRSTSVEPLISPEPQSPYRNRTFNYFDPTQIELEQSNDIHIQQTIQHLKTNPTHSSFVMKNRILHKLIPLFARSKKKSTVIYLPSSLVRPLLLALHNDPLIGSHFSTERMLHKIRSHFWWPNMKSSIDTHVRSCLSCAQHNFTRHKPHGHLSPIPPPPGPFELIGMDYCGPFQMTPRENRYVLVITDYYSRYVTAVPLPNCTAEITALTLYNEFFCKFGVPTTILSDQGSHFLNHLMRNLQQLIGYNHIYSTTYHPQTNGVVERFNATFVPQLAKLQDINHNNWDEFLPAVVFAYNTGIHRTTHYSPYELIFGRCARLPIQPPATQFSFPRPNDYFEQLKKTLKLYCQFARANVIRHQQQSKSRYDLNRSNSSHPIGAKVLVKIHGIQGKLHPKFSPIPHTIINVNHPTYTIRNDITNTELRVHAANLRSLLTP